MENRIEYFEKMLADNPNNPTGLLALANEYGKADRDEDEAVVLRRYVEAHEDEGNAYLRLGGVLEKLGRKEEARACVAKMDSATSARLKSRLLERIERE